MIEIANMASKGCPRSLREEPIHGCPLESTKSTSDPRLLNGSSIGTLVPFPTPTISPSLPQFGLPSGQHHSFNPHVYPCQQDLLGTYAASPQRRRAAVGTWTTVPATIIITTVLVLITGTPLTATGTARRADTRLAAGAPVAAKGVTALPTFVDVSCCRVSMKNRLQLSYRADYRTLPFLELEAAGR